MSVSDGVTGKTLVSVTVVSDSEKSSPPENCTNPKERKYEHTKKRGPVFTGTDTYTDTAFPGTHTDTEFKIRRPLHLEH
jgi:hypothetical protein